MLAVLKYVLCLIAALVWQSVEVNTSAAKHFSTILREYTVESGLADNQVNCLLQDDRGIIWVGTEKGLCRFDGYDFLKIALDSSSSRSVYSLFLDKKARLWAGTDNGVFIYDILNARSERFDVATQYGIRIGCSVKRIVEDSAGAIWIGTDYQGIFRYDTTSGELLENSLAAYFICDICPSARQDGDIYAVSVDNNVIRFDAECNSTVLFQGAELSKPDIQDLKMAVAASDKYIFWGNDETGITVLDIDTLHAIGKIDVSGHVNAIRPYAGDVLLVATDNNIYLVDSVDFSFSVLSNRNVPAYMFESQVLDVLRDAEGGTWFATRYDGVGYIAAAPKVFCHNAGFEQIGSNQQIINAFAEDSRGNIWIATASSTLYEYDTKYHQPKPVLLRSALLYDKINTLLVLDQELWIGTSCGLQILNISDRRVKNIKDKTLLNASVLALFADSNRNVYIGTTWGLFIYNPSTRLISPEPRLGNQAQICDIIEDGLGRILFATLNSGLWIYDTHKRIWSHHQSDRMLSVNKVNTLFKSRDNSIWAGVESGLLLYDAEQNCFTPFLSDWTVNSIEQDADGYLWLGGDNGLMQLNPSDVADRRIFNAADGLGNEMFQPNSSLCCTDGALYFGGRNGFTYFKPSEFVRNNYIPTAVVTAIKVMSYGHGHNNEVQYIPIHEGTRQLVLEPWQNNIAFLSSVLSYNMPSHNTFSHRLQGYDNNWIDDGRHNTAQYVNLPIGRTYTFNISGRNDDGVASVNNQTLTVKIRQVFYKSTLAVVIYCVSAILLVICIVLYVSRKRTKNVMLVQEQNNYRSKIDFFTNFAHEIKTPLSLVKLPLEYINGNEVDAPTIKHYLKMMERNIDNLYELTNQLLDFRRIEASDMELTYRCCDLKQLIGDVCGSFRSVVEIKKIKILTSLPDDYYANVDSAAIVRILSNLISNAVKYARDTIIVSLVPHDDSFEINVEDNGVGIDAAECERIFDMFYKAPNSKGGTGIGLKFAKQLTVKHNGTICARPNNGRCGTTFTVSIPMIEIGQTIVAKESSVVSGVPILPEKQSIDADKSADAGECDELATVLIVDDNAELLNLLRDYLSKFYNVVCVINAKQALATVEQTDISLIVSDVMMSEMNGFELCKTIKNDMRYSHIPVILLTAKNMEADKVYGMKMGADSYIEKPCSLEFIHYQILNILQSRQNLRNIYSGSLSELDSDIAECKSYNAVDAEFVSKLENEVQLHMANENFYIEDMAENLFMSRSNFYRKIRSLFGVSPNTYLKNVRLKYAVKLLIENGARVNEVYTEVGFGSHSYFTKCFRQLYGCTPTQYLKKNGR